MKWLALLAFAPLMSHALISPEAIQLARLEQEAASLHHQLGGCSITEDDAKVEGLDRVKKKKDKRAVILANEVENDLLYLKEDCQNSRSAVRLLAIAQQSSLLASKLGIRGTLPSSAGVFHIAQDEQNLEASSEATVKSMDRDVCPTDEIPNDLLSWHAFFLENGYICTAKTFRDQAKSFNKERGLEKSQSEFDALASLSLNELKKLFKAEFKDELQSGKMKIAFIPQLSYENGMLSGTFPYKFFLNETEKTGYSFLKKQFSKLGVDVAVIYRNSLASLDEQVATTEAGLAELKSPHLIISRSMGSRVMNEIKKRAEQGLGSGLDHVASWYNVGGTPNGSVIADYKSRPDMFYRGVFPQVTETLKLPLNLIAMDPRVVDHLPNTIYSALDRRNLPTMAHFEELNTAGDANSSLKVFNLVFVPPAYERATQGVDPVYTHMLSYGPTEGSSPLAGAAVDTTQSARVTYDLDHLAFWKLSPQEGMALYLRTLIAGKRMGLAF